MQLSEPALDQVNFVNDRKKVIIATSPRSGSFMLCRLMINAGLGLPHEYFNPIHYRIIAPRLEIPRLRGHFKEEDKPDLFGRYIDRLLSMRTLNGVFAAKIQFWQFRNFLNNSAGAALFAGAHFIHLYREDVLGQAMSFHSAQVTGRWGFDDSVTTPPNPNGDIADPEGINHALNELLNEDREWRRIFAQNAIKPLSRSYEELVANPKRAILDIATHIEYEGELKLGYSEKQESHAPNARAPDKKLIRQNYLMKKGLLAPSELKLGQ